MFAANFKAWDEKCHSGTERCHLTVSCIWQHHQGKEQGKKEKGGKKCFLQRKKEANCAFLAAGLISGIKDRKEAGIIQETAVAALAGDQKVSTGNVSLKNLLIMVLLSQPVLAAL